VTLGTPAAEFIGRHSKAMKGERTVKEPKRSLKNSTGVLRHATNLCRSIQSRLL
jgi:hypothetical protein